MTNNTGLIGLRPSKAAISDFVAPPYDVLHEGTRLYDVLQSRKNLARIHARPHSEGEARYSNARKALEDFKNEGLLVEDKEPCYYVYRQTFEDGSRIGVMLAIKVSDYKEGQVVRHERTFDDKVTDRRKLREALGYQVGVVFGVAEDREGALLSTLNSIAESEPLYSFSIEFEGASDMEGIRNEVWRVPESSQEGARIKQIIEGESFYIADGHHRYHCALLMGQEYVQSYVSPSESAKILAYDRVVGSIAPEKLGFLDGLEGFEVSESGEFGIPPKHSFLFYFKDRVLSAAASESLLAEVSGDVVSRLDASLLQERILFPKLGLSAETLKDKNYFNYFPGNDQGLEKMRELVDNGDYQFAVSLAPVDFSELKAVADKGITNPDVVMPQKSTYFWPKLLSGLMLYEYS